MQCYLTYLKMCTVLEEKKTCRRKYNKLLTIVNFEDVIMIALLFFFQYFCVQVFHNEHLFIVSILSLMV